MSVTQKCDILRDVLWNFPMFCIIDSVQARFMHEQHTFDVLLIDEKLTL
jgi:hypothetical protein